MKTLAILGFSAFQGIDATMYNPAKTPISVYGSKNFDTQVSKNRAKGISVVQFYKKSDGRAKGEKEDFEKLGSDLKDMIRVGAVDCDDFWKICESEKVTSFPTYRVYPPFPAPTQDFEGDALDI